MAEPRPSGDQVVDMAEYLRDTLAEIDAVIAELTSRRMGIAARLAVIRAASDPATQTAAADYVSRTQEGRPYEDAQDANDLIVEAHRRFVQ